MDSGRCMVLACVECVVGGPVYVYGIILGWVACIAGNALKHTYYKYMYM